MKRLRSFFKTALIGGLVVILPIMILIVIFRWLYQLLSGMIAPLTQLIIERTALQVAIADAIVLLIILAICFVLGVFVKTRLGNYIYKNTENSILTYAPGYTMIKETILLFLGRKKTPFSHVALISPYNSSTYLTGFVTDERENGMVTVFVPTAPNPTSGNIYHLLPKDVIKLDISIEEGIRTILSCGVGSGNFTPHSEIDDKKAKSD